MTTPPPSEQTFSKMTAAALYARYHASLVAEAMRCGLGAEEAEDVAQQVWVAYLRCPPVLRGDNPAACWRAWASRGVRNQAEDKHRRRRRRPTRNVDELRGGSQERAAPEKDGEKREEKQRLLELVWEAVDRLPGGPNGINARIMVLRYREGKGLMEITAPAQRTPGQVKARLHRARATLRRLLDVGRPPPTRRAARRRGKKS